MSPPPETPGEEPRRLGGADRRAALEPRVRRLAAAALGVGEESLAHDRALSSLGLDSLAAVELQWAVEAEVGVSPDLGSLLGGASVGKLVDELLAGLDAASSPGSVGGEAGSAVAVTAASAAPAAAGSATAMTGSAPTAASPSVTALTAGSAAALKAGSAAALKAGSAAALKAGSAAALKAGSAAPAAMGSAAATTGSVAAIPPGAVAAGPVAMAAGLAAGAAARSSAGGEAGEAALTEGQLGLWLAQRLSPRSSAYTIAAAARVLGEVDTAAFEGALQVLAMRHDALRTTFVEAGGRVVQRVSSGGGIAFVVHESAAWSEAELESRLAASVERPFDLAAGPLWRLELYRRDGGPVLCLAVHHLVADLWSLSVLLRELGAAYGALAGGAAASLPEAPPLRYADYVSWQQERLGGAAGERLWSYWRGQLADLPSSSELPADRERPAAPTLAGAVRSQRLGAALSSALVGTAASWGVSPFVLGLSALVALLHRYTGQEDLAVGSPASGRPSSRLEGLVGYLANPLVLRADLTGRPSLPALAARLQATVASALAHQELPFAWLAQRLSGVRDGRRSPLFQVLFTLPRSPDAGQGGLGAFALGEGGGRLRLGPLELASVPLAPCASQFDLSLRLAPVAEAWVASAQYSTDLYDDGTIERFLVHYGELLSSALREPGTPLDELAWLSAAEREEVLRRWNATAVDRDVATTLPELFFAQAGRAPERVAAIAGERWLSYGELASRSRRLSSRLSALGVGAEDRVGVLVGRDQELLVALLGVSGAGGAWVGLDPQYPAERSAFMLADAGARLVLLGEGLAAALPALPPGASLLALGSPASPAASALAAPAPAGTAPAASASATPTSAAPTPASTASAAPTPAGTAPAASASATPTLAASAPAPAGTALATPTPASTAPAASASATPTLAAPAPAGTASATPTPASTASAAPVLAAAGSTAPAPASAASVLAAPAAAGSALPAPAVAAGGAAPVPRPAGAGAGNLAYLIYTSGSTGRPKGVAVEHRSAVELVRWAAGVWSGEELSGVLASTSVCFDLSVFELFVPLCLGGTVILAQNVLSLPRLPSVERVRLVNTVPSLLAELLRQGDLPPGVGTVNLAGEALPEALASALRGSGTVRRVLNLYGPSEDTTYSTCSEVGPGRPSIGRPVSNTRAYVVDGRGEPLPVGVAGELWLGGAGLARGYLGRPELTAERFVPDRFGVSGPPGVSGPSGASGPPGASGPTGGPIGGSTRTGASGPPDGAIGGSAGTGTDASGPIPASGPPGGSTGPGPTGGGRLYRTGDRVRLLPTGDLDYLGRLDQQVKLRGLRVELGEVEWALRGHPEVREAAAMVREVAGETRLVAYVAGTATAEALRDSLRQQLLEAMVPSHFVVLAALPRTPNGKLDRRALPPPSAASAARRAWSPPRGPLEELVAGIFAEVLGRPQIGAEDSFFDLGGHSLLATQVLSRVEETCGVTLPLRAVFEAPTVAALARRLAAALASRSGSVHPAAPPLVALPRPRPLPLSFAQERLWLLDRLERDGAAHSLCGAFRVQGPLCRAALEGALDRVVARHESLRTTFPAASGRPEQLPGPPAARLLPLLDLRALPPARRAAAVEERIAALARHVFDLARGPLFVAALLRVDDSESVLLLNLHHIVADGWSLAVLAREIERFYTALAAGRPADAPALPIQYADFALWQRRWLQGAALEPHLDYWRRVFPDGQQLLDLPTDRPRPAVQSFRGALRARQLAPDLVAGVERLSRAAGVTPFMTYLGAFLGLLERYTGQSDLTVGTFIANRNRAEIEGLIGFFVNNLALRVALPESAAFRQVLARVKEATLGAYAHQDLPFEKLLADLRLERTAERTPLFQVMLVLQNLPPHTLALPGLAVAPLPVPRTRSNFDLTLWLEDRGRGLEAAVEYNRDLFAAATIERLLGHFCRALDAVAADPERRDVPLLTAAEEQQLAREWNAVAATAPAPAAAAHRQVAEQARRTPEAVAVAAPGAALTYGELAARARRLARRLAAAGVSPEILVGLYHRRSPELLVGALAILEAGGAYLPLDPLVPVERLRWMLEDSGTTLVVTEERLADRLAGLGIDALCLDTPAAPAAPPPAAPAAPPAGEQLAYLIYTSGSTGRPKAVMVPHGALANYTRAARRRYRLAPGDRVLQFASISFDASAEEIFPTLASGGTLVLRDDAMLASPAEFLAACAAWSLTVLDLPTSYWHEIVAAADAPGWVVPPALRLVIIGGEKALAERVERWTRLAPAAACLINTYGPTEATIVATWHDLPPGAPAPPSGRVPIGRPVDGVAARLLDRAGRLAPAGVPAELCLAGAGLARGYLRRPDLTAERFVPDPHADLPGGRLYRSGDRARLLADGRLEFLDRHDRQVKIRGYRIEPGEIEALLAGHPLVREAVVVATAEAAGRVRLLAYLTARTPEPPDPAELRAFLRQRLPDYMIPSALVVVEALPRNASGKVDRAALPDVLPTPSPDAAPGYVAPRTPSEEILAGIWAEVLGLDTVGVHDDFFDLGGYSLLATQVIARFRDATGVELPLATLFEQPTVAALAAAAGSGERIPPIAPVPRDGDLPLSFSQERVWFLTQLAPSLTSYHVPRALRLVGPLDLGRLALAYEGLVARHEILRTTFPVVAGGPVQRIQPPSPFRLALADLTALPVARREDEVQRLVLELGRQLFDLARGPMLRAAALRLAAEHHVVVQTEHHLVHDGWAEGILARDLLGIYNACVAGRAPELPRLPIQFADFAVWQRRWLTGEVLADQLDYWRRQLVGARPLLELPTDRPRPAVQGNDGDERELRLAPDLLADLERQARRANVTLFMSTLAAFAVVLARWSGQSDLVLGTGVANRRHAETEGLLGMIINTVALRLRVEPGATCGELLSQVREVCAGAYAHQDLPFEKVVQAVSPPRSLSHAPIFQVMFAFHDGPPRDLIIPGVAVTPLPSHNRSSKFDILVIAVPQRPRAGAAGAARGAVSELAFHLEFDRQLFDAPTLVRLLGHFDNTLRAMVRDASLTVGEVPLLSPVEAHQIVHEWGAGAPLAPAAPACLHELFAAQAARSPDAVALVGGQASLTYRGLADRAARLARRLAALGVGPEARVAVAMQRTPEMVVALLAVLAAGGAYVPVDPAYPPAHQAWTLDSSGAILVLTESALLGGLPATAPPVLCVDLPSPSSSPPSPSSSSPPAAAPTAANLAYVIFTSGSTGRPKGVAIEHRGAVALVRWARTAFAPRELAGVLAATSICFDLSVFELFVPLCSGGTVILAKSILELPALAGAAAVTLINTVPSAIAELLATGLRLPAATTVNLAGEALRRPLVARLQELPEVTRVLNLYGPSETTTYSTWAVMDRRAAPPAVGRPIAGTRAYPLDRRLAAVPAGVAGELHLGGAGVARGYLGRPAATAERFLPDPFAGEPGARMYRTGDLVRQRADGELEHLGRVDLQVKVRGFRIELPEIEAVLAAHPAVAACAVAVRLAAAGDPLLVAFFVAAAGEHVAAAGERAAGGGDAAALRAFLAARLPAHMVPALFVPLPALPTTPSGKLDRRALPEAAQAAPSRPPAASFEAARTGLERRIAAVWRELLGVERVGLHDNFFELGAHSLLMVRAAAALREAVADRLTLLDLFRYPTVAALAAALAPGGGAAAPPAPPSRPAPADPAEAIAVIGMKGRFPGARDLDQLWRNLRDGVEMISFFSAEELLARGVPAALVADPAYVRAGTVLADADRFDAAFFGYSPREAELMDPQHRLFLECAAEVLDDAGYDPARYPGAIGVFAGVGANRYWLNLHAAADLLDGDDGYQALLGNDKDFLATRVAYKLDLRGPSLNVQTACSTSLVAAHLACQSLRLGECDMAIVGGVAVRASQGTGYRHTAEGIASPDGHCRPFDAAGRGTVAGNGLVAVVLKRLSRALADGDTIRALIRGSAVNNDGARKVGYTAPSVAGQARAIAAAHAAAGVAPEAIGYVEAHGTGTQVGDPIEVAALCEAFAGAAGARPGTCAIGSLKSNLGHLDAAAGLAGLVKTVLALEHGEIPPSLHFQRPNPAIDFAAGPFYVAARPLPWPAGAAPRLAGVSSFGIGGTNAHVVVEEAPAAPPPAAAPAEQLLVLSAKSPAALERTTDNLAAHLGAHPELGLADAAYTLLAGRGRWHHRRALVCDSLEDAAAALARRDPARLLDGVAGDAARRIVFLFPGSGAHYPGMAAGLQASEPVFGQELDRCLQLLAARLDCDLRPIFATPPAGETGAGERLLERIDCAMAAIFAVEVALARLWMSWGVEPQALAGHSLGELAAACLAGVMSLADAATLVALRGRLLQALPPGRMLSVALPAAELLPRLAGDLAVAAVNGPAATVVSGPPAAVAALHEALARDGIDARLLRVERALHSPAVEPLKGDLRQAAAAVRLAPPRIPFVSGVTGTWIRDDEAVDPEHWVRHLRQTVRFGDALAELLGDPTSVFLEVGPGQALSSLLRRHPGRGAGHTVLPLLRHAHGGESDRRHALDALARLWLAGVDVQADGVHGGLPRRRVPLPSYPFAGDRYWIARRPVEPGAAAALGPGAAAARRPAAGKRADLGDWFFVPVWRPAPPPPPSPPAASGERWLVFVEPGGVGTLLAAALARSGRAVTAVSAGAGFARLHAGAFTVAPGRPEDYVALLAELGRADHAPTHVVHLWSLGERAPRTPAEPAFETAQTFGFYSLLALGRALELHRAAGTVRIDVVTDGVQTVDGSEALAPAKATALAAVHVLPQENRDLVVRGIDLAAAEVADPSRHAQLADRLLAEVLAPAAGGAVAYRRRCRYVQDLDPLHVPAAAAGPPLTVGGVYLITGGLGRIGLHLAALLARVARARLALVGRAAFPARAAWDGWLTSHDRDDGVSRRIRRLLDLEAQGAEVCVLTADAGDEPQLRAAVAAVRERFGGLDGVIHAAGVVGEDTRRAVAETGPAEAARHFRAKVQGTLALARVLRGERLDFCVLVSSLSTVLGGLGLAAYAAANHFLDAFARQRRQEAGDTPWLSLAYGAWEAAAAVEPGADGEAAPPPVERANGEAAPPAAPGADGEAAPPAALGAGVAALAMTAAEGVEVFQRALSMLGLPNLVVSAGDLGAQRGRWAERPAAAPPRQAATAAAHRRPDLANAYVAPAGDTEVGIAEIWQQLLGIDAIGAHDSFFALGGDSLLATRLVAALRRRFQAELGLRTLFERPTIAALAAHVAGAGRASGAGGAAPIVAERRSRGILDQLAELEGLPVGAGSAELRREDS